MLKRNYKCSIGKCPFCLALHLMLHSPNCPLMIGFDSDEAIADIIEFWQQSRKVKCKHCFSSKEKGWRCKKCGLNLRDWRGNKKPFRFIINSNSKSLYL